MQRERKRRKGRKEWNEVRKAERERERRKEGKKEKKAPSAGQVSIPGAFYRDVKILGNEKQWKRVSFAFHRSPLGAVLLTLRRCLQAKEQRFRQWIQCCVGSLAAALNSPTAPTRVWWNRVGASCWSLTRWVQVSEKPEDLGKRSQLLSALWVLGWVWFAWALVPSYQHDANISCALNSIKKKKSPHYPPSSNSPSLAAQLLSVNRLWLASPFPRLKGHFWRLHSIAPARRGPTSQGDEGPWTAGSGAGPLSPDRHMGLSSLLLLPFSSVTIKNWQKGTGMLLELLLQGLTSPELFREVGHGVKSVHL